MRDYFRNFWVELLFIAIIWIVYGYFVYQEPNSLIGIFFPLGLTAMGADLIGDRMRKMDQ